MENTLFIVAAVICIASYIAQALVIKSIQRTTGKNLATGRIWPVLASVGLLSIGLMIAGGMSSLFSSGEMSDFSFSDGPWEIVLMLVSAAALIILLVRNIKGAGVGKGILLTCLQSCAGLLILAVGALKIALSMMHITLGTPAPPAPSRPTPQQIAAEKDDAAQRQEAYAQHYGYVSAQQAWDAGFTEGIDPDLF
ncbi:MAG: hypothetical protein RR949_04225 [Oscillospiraceae bacterium]